MKVKTDIKTEESVLYQNGMILYPCATYTVCILMYVLIKEMSPLIVMSFRVEAGLFFYWKIPLRAVDIDDKLV